MRQERPQLSLKLEGYKRTANMTRQPDPLGQFVRAETRLITAFWKLEHEPPLFSRVNRPRLMLNHIFA